MSELIVTGGKKLKGVIVNQPAKNSALAIVCACLLIKQKVILRDVPQIEEIKRMLELLNSIGVKAGFVGPRQVEIDSSGNLYLDKMDKKSALAMRSSLLLFGALAKRIKRYKLYKSGGCRLGERTVRPHIFALGQLGVKINSKAGYYEVNNSVLRGQEIVMYESGDTATENTIMASVLAQGTTIIKMASANYMVSDLCYFLNSAGAKISGIGSATLTIEGVKQLRAVQNYHIMPDPIVAMTFLSVGIATGSHVTVADCPLDFLELELCKLRVMGQKFKIKKRRQSANGYFKVADIELIPSPLFALLDKIYGRPFPGLNVDNLPLFVPILCQARGRTLVHDWAYENRSIYLLDLQKMGVKITMLDPHRIWVEGPTEFKPASLKCPPALRVAVVLLICMLAAKGRSILSNTYAIDRGYENIYSVLNQAGADIKIVDDNKSKIK